ncbi:sialic acid-binding Ig-like lectin 5 [Anabas testudineus]|uniref:sialic acid-binding Ig-like lectin 5 n=1 Tax=Anabas testudineus TaxID=64144 RepID=UPI000E453C81|nr:sialic acid-binding Ig-like lectin 5 [Anabas testudineus]XP_026227302.1 sialic acid-binding Ig-like lectin 5 [Anabas testudineus]XP_026227303.1 sialic acid-binding Ig-like lectin 5 [Anabas testudineus]XP_026227304.1 sialic acid-binding Ig-like lectin 5 [Anabas testudineus]
MGTAHLLRLLSLLTGILLLQQVRGSIITVPQKITAVEGSCVVVPCQTKPYSRVIWYQYHRLHYPVVYASSNVAEQFKGRTSLLGKAAEGDCSLMINDVRSDDNNLQIYAWIYPESDSNKKFYDQTVTITVERRSPVISIHRQIISGEIFQADCSLTYSCPFSPPVIQWHISLDMKNSTSMIFNKEENGQWLHTNTLYGLGIYQMHNSKIRCSAQFKSIITESQQITLSVLYKPVMVTLTAGKEPVIEGGSITAECAANCNPQPHLYSWFRRHNGQIKKINSTQRKMSFSNIIRDTSFSCVVHNEIGVGQSDWLDLDVQHAPAILPESSCHLTGEVLRCFCSAKAAPVASIIWRIDGNETKPASSFLSTKEKNVISEEISRPAKRQTNVYCFAWNSLGNDTKLLSKRNLSKTSSLSTWLPALLFVGMALLFGAMFFYRKYFADRPQSDQDSVLGKLRYTVQRSPSSPCRPERNPEVDRLSSVYDNDFLVEMSRPSEALRRNSNRTVPKGGGRILAKSEGMYCNMAGYPNR